MKANERLIRTEASARISELKSELNWLKEVAWDVHNISERIRIHTELLESRIEAERQSV